MLAYLEEMVNGNVDKSKILTTSKDIWSDCGVSKHFNAIIYCMGNPEKMKTIGGLDSLDALSKKMRQIEESEKIEKESQDKLEIPVKETATESSSTTNRAKENYNNFFSELETLDTGQTPEKLRIELLRKQLGYKEGENHLKSPKQKEKRFSKNQRRNNANNIFLKKEQQQPAQETKPKIPEKEKTPETKASEIDIKEGPIKDRPFAYDSYEQPLGRRTVKSVEDLIKEREAPRYTVESLAEKIYGAEELDEGEVQFMIANRAKIQDILKVKMSQEKAPNNLKIEVRNSTPEIKEKKETQEKEIIPKVKEKKALEPLVETKRAEIVSGGNKEAKKTIAPNQEESSSHTKILFDRALGRLGVDKEELFNKFPEFSQMSPNQQLYTLKKLEQKVDRDLDRNAFTELEAKDAQNKKLGFLGKMARGATKGLRLSALRKQMSNNQKSIGFESYKDDLKDLTDFVSTRGLDVGFNEQGRMILEFISREGENAKHQKLIDDFNTKASKLSDVPYDWTTEHAVPALKKQASIIRRSFEKSRKALLNYEASGKNKDEKDKEKLLEFTNIDSEIQMSQFLNHNTGIAGKLNQFVKNNKFLEKGGLMALGYGVRGLAQYAIAFGGGLVGSSLIGGATSWIRKSSELRKLEENQRRGIDINENKDEKDKVKGVKQAISIPDQTKKINNLIQHIKKSSGERREKSLETLQTRISIVQDRIENLGAVNFGRNELASQADFVRAVKEANTLLIELSGERDEAVEAVYREYDKRFLHDEERTAERKKEITKAIRNGMLIGAGLFTAGFVARDLIGHNGQALKEAWTWVKDATGDAYGVLNGGGAGAGLFTGGGGGFGGSEHFTNSGSGGEAMRTINPVSEDVSDIKTAPIEQTIIPETPIIEQNFSVNADHRGVIGLFDNLQKQIEQAYPNGEVPENLKYLTDKNPEELAKMFGGYRPGQADGLDSLLVNKEASLSVNENGLIFKDGLGGEKVITPDSGFEGKFINSNPISTEDTISPDTTNAGVIENPSSEDMTDMSIFEKSPTSEDTSSADYFYNNVGPGTEDVPQTDSALNTTVTPENNIPYKQVGIEGIKINTPEISGRINVQYDNFGRVTKMDLGTSGTIAEVKQFLATPDKFINQDVIDSAITRSTATYELSSNKLLGAEYLKMRNFLNSGEFKPGTPEFKYLNEQMDILGEKIHKNVGNIFKPLEEDRATKAAGSWFGETAQTKPLPSVEENIKTANPIIEDTPLPKEETLEIIRTTNHTIDPESKLIKSTIEKYGQVKIDGNVAVYDKGYIGFYDESMDQVAAGEKSVYSAGQNVKLLNGVNKVDQIYSKMPDGTYRVLTIYKKAL